MSEYKYGRGAFSKAMGIFEEHLKQRSPETLEMLQTSTIGFNYPTETCEAFTYRFFDQDRACFERLSKAPFVEVLREATGAIEFDLKLKLKELGTRLEHETWFEHTKSGIQVRHLIRDDSGNEQNIERN